MKILFVAMSQSIHTARWVNQITDQVWDLNIFPSWELTIHPQLANLTAWGFKTKPENVPASVNLILEQPKDQNNILHKIVTNRLATRIIRSTKLRKFGFGKLFEWLERNWKHQFTLPDYVSEEERAEALALVIKTLKPDIIHSLEIQHAGYLTLAAKKIFGDGFPTWIVTNWGADIHHFGEFPDHAEKIRATLEACDYYGCECQRDVKLAQDFGFKGEVLPVITNTGGFDFEYVRQFRQPGKISQRKIIALKGYQGWVYRALIGLQAIEMCADVILQNGYKVVIYLASAGVPEAAEQLQKRTGIPIEFRSYTSHENMLKLHGQARVSMGLSMSDAISTSFLEASVMGSFPIQSCTSCADEWAVSGQSAFLVAPEDPSDVANALRQALTDDDLVDRAAEINGRKLMERLDYRKVRETVIASYEKIYNKEPLV